MDLLHVHDSSCQLAAVGDDNWFFWPVISIAWICLHLIKDIHSISHFSEDAVSAVEMRSINEAKEELRAVGITASICHG